MKASRARLFKEYKEVQREKTADPDIQLVCDDSNIFKWTALIKVVSKLKNGGKRKIVDIIYCLCHLEFYWSMGICE